MPEQEDSQFRDRGHRVPEGQGVSAPFAAESGGPPQMSVFDGAGNESVVTLGVNEDGRVAEGTGADLDEAMKDAAKGDSLLGDDFDPKHTPK